MKLAKGDYFVAAREQGKDYLAKALSNQHGNTVEAVLEDKCHIQGLRHTMTVDVKDVVVVLGPTPHPGKVYGADVTNLFRARKDHDDFGPIHFFYKPEKEIVKDLWISMSKVSKRLDKHGLGFLLQDIMWEVQRFNGEKYAGCYISSRNEKVPVRIQFRPESVPATEYAYVLLHELGHHLHLEFIKSKKLNAYWLKLFNTSIKVVSVRKDLSKQLLERLLDQDAVPSDFKRDLDEEEALAFKWIIRTISTVSALSIKDLDTLFEAGFKDEVAKVWPVRNIPRKELAPVISEYSTKNVKELFAEVFAFHMTGKKLPDAVVRLLEKSISYAKTQKEK
jgi:hypothetical protein